MSESEIGTELSEEEVRSRAYEISQGPDGGSDEENWHRAVEELRRRAGGGQQNGSSDVEPGAEPS